MRTRFSLFAITVLTLLCSMAGILGTACAEQSGISSGSDSPAEKSASVSNSSASPAPTETAPSSAASTAPVESVSRTAFPSSDQKTYNDPRLFDGNGNLTLFAPCELDGTELQAALQANGYTWIDSAKSWMTPSGQAFEARGAGGFLAPREIDALGKGASDAAIVYIIVSTGYATPSEALDNLVADALVAERFDDPEGVFSTAIVRDHNLHKVLTVVTQTSTNQHTLMLFGEKAIEADLFLEVAGVNTAKSLPAIWSALTEQDG